MRKFYALIRKDNFTFIMSSHTTVESFPEQLEGPTMATERRSVCNPRFKVLGSTVLTLTRQVSRRYWKHQISSRMTGVRVPESSSRPCVSTMEPNTPHLEAVFKFLRPFFEDSEKVKRLLIVILANRIFIPKVDSKEAFEYVLDLRFYLYFSSSMSLRVRWVCYEVCGAGNITGAIEEGSRVINTYSLRPSQKVQ